MVELPRLALGTVQPEVPLRRPLWALFAAFRQSGIDPQVFSSQSRFDVWNGLVVPPGHQLRHLDSWLMTCERSGTSLAQGGLAHDLSLVVGRLRRPAWHDDSTRTPVGGSLDQLASWLDLPRIVWIDVSLLDPCRLVDLPDGTAGILLDGCEDPTQLARWQTRLESLWGIPVLGGLCAPREMRVRWQMPVQSETTQRARCAELGGHLAPYLRLDRLLELARAAPPLHVDPHAGVEDSPARALRVAVAYDEAFHCYFRDTLDALERMGTQLTDFSPLKSESIPAETDLVWLGCGHPEQYAERLTRNVCLRQSLHAHVRAGGRVYAEGGGLAYICESLSWEQGCYPMAGLLAARALFVPSDSRPVEMQLVGDPWLGRQCVRGYLNPCWAIETDQGVTDFSAQSDCPVSLIGDGPVIGSRIHLHFAAQPGLLKSFVSPRSA